MDAQELLPELISDVVLGWTGGHKVKEQPRGPYLREHTSTHWQGLEQYQCLGDSDVSPCLCH